MFLPLLVAIFLNVAWQPACFTFVFYFFKLEQLYSYFSWIYGFIVLLKYMFILQNNFNVKTMFVQVVNQCDLDCLHIKFLYI
jgi:hypothetical protein